MTTSEKQKLLQLYLTGVLGWLELGLAEAKPAITSMEKATIEAKKALVLCRELMADNPEERLSDAIGVVVREIHANDRQTSERILFDDTHLLNQVLYILLYARATHTCYDWPNLPCASKHEGLWRNRTWGKRL